MKPMLARISLAAAAALLAAPAPVDAQTLYKLIGKDGKVTYAEKPPKDFDGKVIRMDIDPNANTATLPKPPAPASSKPSSDGPPRKSSEAPRAENSVQAARDKLDAARKALKDARDNPGEDEVQRVGTTSGFTRPVPTEAYEKRLAGLEEAVRRAETELRNAEGR